MGIITKEDLDKIVDINGAREWADLPEETWDCVDKWLGGLGGNLKVLGLIGKEGIQQTLQAVRVPHPGFGERVLHPVEYTGVASMWRVARQKCNLPDEDPMPTLMRGDKNMSFTPGVMAKNSKYLAWRGKDPKDLQLKPKPKARPAYVPPRPPRELADSLQLSQNGVLTVKGFSYAGGTEHLRVLFHGGTDCGQCIPIARWDYSQYYEEAPPAWNRFAVYTKHAVFIDMPEMVDWQFFQIKPAVAKMMDPQQRSCLKQGYRAFVNAKKTRHELEGSLTGVYVGSMNFDYLMDLGGLIDRGNMSMLANRVSHSLGLNGPSVFIDTGCSSSLVTADMAATHVKRGRCTQGLAMGVNHVLSPQMFTFRCAGSLLSRIGRSAAFDKNSDGYCVGEGCAGIVFGWSSSYDSKTIFHMGSQVMQDGRSAQLTAPSGPAQQELVRDTMRRATIAPADIAASECQCNGSHMGDPIEFGALEKIHNTSDRTNNSMYMVSGKSQKGHGEGNAGMTTLVKTILFLQDHIVPAVVHLGVLNDHIDVEGMPWVLPNEPSVMPERERLTTCGSSFGWGGVNGHMILQTRKVRSQMPDQLMLQMAQQQMGAYPWQQAPEPAQQEAAPAPAAPVAAASAAGAVEVHKGLEKDDVSAMVKEIASQSLDGDIPDLDTPLMDSGLDSLAAISFRNSLQQQTGLSLKGTLMFDYPTMGEIVDHVVEVSTSK